MNPIGTSVQLSASQARRMALAAQGFTDPRPTGRVTRSHLRRVFDRVGLIQIDSVNVLVRSQELPLFARLGPHPRSLIPDATKAKELFEYWGHEASHIPTAHHHLFRWKMASIRTGTWRIVREQAMRESGYVEKVLDKVRIDGPIVAADIGERPKRKGPWWDWDTAKFTLEYLFESGELTATRRVNDFARVYDLPERVLPPEVLATPTPAEPDARKQLLLMAARSMGVATAGDLADYYRQKMPTVRPLLAELVEEGLLLPATVEGWKQPAYMHPDAKPPRWVRARALLSPFDSLVWNRDRTLRLWDFHYRIEIYTPPPKRIFGYYVLPFLLGDDLVARIDLKADRQQKLLLVQAAHTEHHRAPGEIADELAAELRLMAEWLGLDGIHVNGRGDLAPALRPAVQALA